MHPLFTSDFFAGNRVSLRKALKSDVPIVITANGSMQRAADEPYKFIQDSNFWYLTGISTPDLVLVMTPQETFLIAPLLSREREVFDGAHDLQDFTARSGITDIVDEQTGWQRIRAALATAHGVATLETTPAFMPRHRLHTLPYRRRLITRLRRVAPGVKMKDIRTHLARLRSVKQPAEIQALRQAIDITTATLHDVARPEVLTKANHEYQLEALITYGFRSRGADGHAFEPIVGAGAHSTTLHHVDNVGSIENQDVIVLDIGASVEHYAADITRTISQTAFTARQQAVFDAVCRVQDYALTLLRPGVLLPEYEGKVAHKMGEELVGLGLIVAANSDNVRHYFPHATSHFLGLDTHDVGDYRAPLEANMVVTCEPGIYIPEENIGIRIEDDVLITKDGCTVLSSACPRQLTPLQ